MKRTEIPHSDVFVSWNNADRAMKDRIVAYLREHNISCTESDYSCSGGFEQWSREAVSKSTIFLLLYTEHTPASQYVPKEIAAFLELEDHTNRCVPVVTNTEVFKKNVPVIANVESAVYIENGTLSEDNLDKILSNVRMLICNRLFALYRQATAPTYLRLESLLRGLRMTTQVEHTKLYIERSVKDEDGQIISDATAFCKAQDILYMYGPAGSGKSCYIDQLRSASDGETLVLSLSCRDLWQTKDIFEEMYEEFRRYFRNCDYYSRANFKSLLSVKHLLLVLDGLDEIATLEGKKILLKAAETYYNANADRTILFITSRSSLDADMWHINGQTPKMLQLLPLDEEQIKDFGNRMFLLLGDPDKGEEFYVRVHDLADEIRQNPLLLTQLAIIHKENREIPKTVVGIYDTVWEITEKKVRSDRNTPIAFDGNILHKLSSILKSFSAARYRFESQGKKKTTEQIFKMILRNHGFDPDDAIALIEYLLDRAILVENTRENQCNNEFYHKMLKEYFTAVYHYEQCFDDCDDLENLDALEELFSHYDDPYWSAVLQMFLVKADSLVDQDTTAQLYHTLMGQKIADFTLLFDTCRILVRHKNTAEEMLLWDILKRSASGIYPPYGPLFWYVPEYGLYGQLLNALSALQDDSCFTNALALTRDVCWIFGKYHTARSVNDGIDGGALLKKADLTGIRKGLCELFYQGSTDCTEGTDVYPRCFNVAEAKHWMDVGNGIYGRMSTPFNDELGLYSHEMLAPFGDEWVGIVSIEYDVKRIEEILPSRSCKKLCGLFLSSEDAVEIKELAINDKHIHSFYLPEKTAHADFSYNIFSHTREGTFVDRSGLMYYREKIIFPKGMAEIADCAFYGGRSLDTIIIPRSVTEIGTFAFYGCSSLASIHIPDKVTEIGKSAFSGCTSLASIHIPERVTKIRESAFSGCTSLASIHIPEGVAEIGESAFEGCSSLASIVIPRTVRSIGSAAFCGCSSLTSIHIPDKVAEIGESTFEGCASLTTIHIPESVTKIGDSAFSGCSSLAPIHIPDKVTRIGDSAFWGCRSLAAINIPKGVTKIGKWVFVGCTSLTSINIPEGVTEIGDSAFEGCSSLTSINIPDKVTEIEDSAFLGCRSLAAINIPKGVTKIGEWVFAGCTSLTTLHIPEDVAEIGKSAFLGCRSLASINIPESVTKIGDSAFYGCSSFASIHIPEGVAEIGEGAFMDCSSLTSIRISESVTEIGGFAFCRCTSLTSICIPGQLKSIGRGVFTDCIALIQISNCPSFCDHKYLGVSEECVILYREQIQKDIVFQSKTAILPKEFRNRVEIQSLFIPEGITQLGNSAFEGCSSLSSIHLPERVTEIGAHAFEGCTSLTTIHLPEDVAEIGESAFRGCTSLTTIHIPESVTKIESGTFLHCSSLTSIHIPEDVAEIGESAFRGCTSLTSIHIPDKVAEIGESTFEGCASLATIHIPESMTKIEDSAFCGCSSLASIHIPERVTKIGDFAFSGCSSLSSINIPKGVTEIDWSAFEDCSSLTSIHLPKSVTKIGYSAFQNCSSLTTIHIPEGVTKIEVYAFSGCSSLTSIVIPRTVRFIDVGVFARCTGLREITLSRRFEDDLPRIFPGADLSNIKITWL